MPANLPPQYYELEKRQKAAESPSEKLSLLEEMLSIMPKHKGTDKLQADLKRRISQLRKQSGKSSGKRTQPTTIKPEGAGQVVLVGAPNCGKSSLLDALTNAQPEVADYPYTTRQPLAGMAEFEDVKIQLIDLPPLSEETVDPLWFDQVRRADLVLAVLDLADDPLHQIETIENLLAQKRIALAGGVQRPDAEPPAATKPCLIAANKIDAPDADVALELFLDMRSTQREVISISAAQGQNLDQLAGRLFTALDRIRVYTKAPGRAPETVPTVLPRGATVMDLAEEIHKDIAAKLKTARVWAPGEENGRLVQRDYELTDGDVVELQT
jgi:hypothetical protein